MIKKQEDRKRKPLSGKAEFQALRRDLFWTFNAVDESNHYEFVKVEWQGYNDDFWWNNVATTEQAQISRGSNGRLYKIDFRTCEVKEVEE